MYTVCSITCDHLLPIVAKTTGLGLGKRGNKKKDVPLIISIPTRALLFLLLSVSSCWASRLARLCGSKKNKRITSLVGQSHCATTFEMLPPYWATYDFGWLYAVRMLPLFSFFYLPCRLILIAMFVSDGL
ncbi:hypothetical protein F4810DRAFT_570237 [Camillea tinctor]|nr:hypothetical protein F4810DRAFT_570237 [Camillea tinctor]